jgi:hypothetical protein
VACPVEAGGHAPCGHRFGSDFARALVSVTLRTLKADMDLEQLTAYSSSFELELAGRHVGPWLDDQVYSAQVRRALNAWSAVLERSEEASAAC